MIPQFANLSAPFQNTRPLDTHKSAKELLDSKLWAFQVGFHLNLQPSLPTRMHFGLFVKQFLTARAVDVYYRITNYF